MQESYTHNNIPQVPTSKQPTQHPHIDLKSGHLSSLIPTTSTIISKIIHVACNFGKKSTNVSKEEFPLTNYEMQMANSELPICLVPNAYFLPTCNDSII
jgi:hypothetical protein